MPKERIDTTEFAEKMKFIRTQKGVSQGFVARGSSYDKSFICRLEKGERQPNRSQIVYISEAMGLNAEETDSLLMAAGFMPVQANSLLKDPKLAHLDDLLMVSPEPVREFAEQEIDLLIQRMTQFFPQVGNTHAFAD